MLVQMPQQATCSRQELCLVPPAQKRQIFGILCRRHMMLVQKLQQAAGIWTSIRLVSSHLHTNGVVDFNALCRVDTRLVQVMCVGRLAHAACCMAPASQRCSHAMVVLCCAGAGASG